jgi:hypothetical protein
MHIPNNYMVKNELFKDAESGKFVLENGRVIEMSTLELKLVEPIKNLGYSEDVILKDECEKYGFDYFYVASCSRDYSIEVHDFYGDEVQFTVETRMVNYFTKK